MDILARARAGDDAAFAALERHWSGLLRAAANRMYAPGLEPGEDLLQEARIGLFKAVRDYEPSRGVPFGPFLALCVERQVVTAVKTAQREKHGPLNRAVAFEAMPPDDEAAAWEPADVAADPAERLELKERAQEMLRFLREEMSPLEARGLWMVEAEDCSYEVAAAELGCSTKTLDNAIQRARRKLAARFAPGAVGACGICEGEVPSGVRRCRACEEEIEFARSLIAA